MIYPHNRATIGKVEKNPARNTSRIADMVAQKLKERRNTTNEGNTSRNEDSSSHENNLLNNNHYNSPSTMLPSSVLMTKSGKKTSSLYSQPPRSLAICGAQVSLSISNPTVHGNSQLLYIEALEQSEKVLKKRVRALEQELSSRQKDKDIISKQLADDNLKKCMYIVELENYYDQSRKLLLSCCMELIDCKAYFCQREEEEGEQVRKRIGSVNGILQNNENLLKNFRYYDNFGYGEVENRDKADVIIELEMLRKTCCLQEKTIHKLRELKEGGGNGSYSAGSSCEDQEVSFQQERRLLRHEINRMFKENQRLKKQIASTYQQFLQTLSKGRPFQSWPCQSLVVREFMKLQGENTGLREQANQLSKEKGYLESRLNQEKQRNLLNNGEMEKLKFKITTLQHQSMDYSRKREQKQPDEQLRLLGQLIQQKDKQIEALQDRILIAETLLEETRMRLESAHSEGTHRKNSEGTQEQGQLIQHNETPNRLTKQDQRRLLLRTKQGVSSIKKVDDKVEQRLQQLQELYEKQKGEKQQVLLWCQKVYSLLKRSDIPAEQIEKHLLKLQEITSENSNSKILNQSRSMKTLMKTIVRHLQQIKILAESFNYSGQKEVESELAVYIGALKERNEVIEEVSNEDGSSVNHTDYRSEAFTDNQDQLSSDDERFS